jgi:hypothetical protein
VLLHELGDDLVLLDELRLEAFDLAVLDLLDARRATRRRLERSLGLVKDLLDPIVDLAGLDTELIGEVRDGLPAAQMSPNDLGLLIRREVPARRVHGTYLR